LHIPIEDIGSSSNILNHIQECSLSDAVERHHKLPTFKYLRLAGYFTDIPS